MRRPDQDGRGLRIRIWWLDRQLALDREDARVVDLQAEGDGKLAQHFPSFFQRGSDRDRRTQELDRAFDVRIAALALGEGRRR